MAPICVNGAHECTLCFNCQNVKVICQCCEEDVKADYYYEILGDIYCPDCVDDLFRKDINL